MGSLSIWHWIITLLMFSIFIVPIWKIVSKAGYNGFFSVLALVPVLNLVMLWVFAFSAWPNTKQK